MTSSKVTSRKGLKIEELETWVQVDPSAFVGEDHEKREQTFNRRRKALRMYAENYSHKEIHDATGIERQSLYRFIERCLENDLDGRPAGFRGLIRYRHIALRNDNIKKINNRIPCAGSLLAVFARFPIITKCLTDYAVLGKRENLKKRETSPSIGAIHAEFLRLCEKEKISFPHYPFNSESEGKPAIRRWVKKIRLEHHLSFLASNDPESARTSTAHGRDDEFFLGVQRCYQRVECDGHKIDLHCTIEIPSPTGDGMILTRISRIWIIALIEARSSAILGYSLCLGSNYSAVDVMRAVRHSLLPWKRRNLTVQTIDYRDGDGLPSGVIDGLSFACFDEFCLDNAKSHLSKLFLSYLERTVAAVAVFPPSRTPNSHAYIEGFFNILEESGIHTMIGTTGSNASDIRKTKGTKDLRYYLTYDLLCDFIDLLIARINGSPGPNSSISRLDVLRSVIKRRTTIIRRIPVDYRDEILRYDISHSSIVAKNHGRPVVRFYGAIYTNDVLSSAFLLIGRALVTHADSDDLRTISCTLDDGTSLGTLFAEARWRQTRHGLVTRREANKLLNKGLFRNVNDIPLAFRLHIESEAKKSIQAASKLKRIQMEQVVPEESLLDETLATSIEAVVDDSVPIQKAKKSTLRPEAEHFEFAYAETINLLKNIRTQYRK